MKPVHLVTVVLLLVCAALGQNPDCRQPWMSADSPAFCAWQTEPSLPEARTYHAVTASDNRVYVLGGFRFDGSTNQVTYYDSVLQSTIGADGRLTTWTVEPSFKGGRSGAAASMVGNCLFLAGGSSSSAASLTYYDDIQYTQIEKDGHLSRWTTSSGHLRIPRSNHSLVAVATDHGTFLNAVGGVTQVGNDTVHLDSIEVAKIGDGCTVGDWMVANYHLKGGRSTPQALVVRNNVVVIGGWGDLDLIDVYDDVETAAARSDGSPSPWRVSPGRLTTGIYGHAIVLAEPEKQSPPSSLASGLRSSSGLGCSRMLDC